MVHRIPSGPVAVAQAHRSDLHRSHRDRDPLRCPLHPRPPPASSTRSLPLRTRLAHPYTRHMHILMHHLRPSATISWRAALLIRMFAEVIRSLGIGMDPQRRHALVAAAGGADVTAVVEHRLLVRRDTARLLDRARRVCVVGLLECHAFPTTAYRGLPCTAVLCGQRRVLCLAAPGCPYMYVCLRTCTRIHERVLVHSHQLSGVIRRLFLVHWYSRSWSGESQEPRSYADACGTVLVDHERPRLQAAAARDRQEVVGTTCMILMLAYGHVAKSMSCSER